MNDEGKGQAAVEGAPAGRGNGAEVLVGGPETGGNGSALDLAGFLGFGRRGFGGDVAGFAFGFIVVVDGNGRVGSLGGLDRDERGDDGTQGVTDLQCFVQSCPGRLEARRGWTHVKKSGKKEDHIDDIKEREGQLNGLVFVVLGLRRAEMDANGRAGQLLVPVDGHHDSPS